MFEHFVIDTIITIIVHGRVLQTIIANSLKTLRESYK